jgi:hypothetical protein
VIYSLPLALFLACHLSSITMAARLRDKLSSLGSSAQSDSAESSSSETSREREKYMLRVSAGPSYDTATHKPVIVNGNTPTAFENEFMTVKVKVRIRNYNGLPRESPSHSPYFDDPRHAKDQYSVGFSFVPKKDFSAANTVVSYHADFKYIK